MIGLIADIHANHWALRRVLEVLRDEVEVIVCCGDIVGYGPDPAACVRLVREEVDIAVQGNHDRYVSNPRFSLPGGFGAFPKHAPVALSEDQIEWLRNLPRQQIVEGYLVVHSWPGGREFSLSPTDLTVDASPDEIVGVLKGHSHRQRVVSRDGRQIVNPGVVGEPRPTKVFGRLQPSVQPKFAVVNPQNRTVSLRKTRYLVETIRRLLDGQEQSIGRT